MFEEFYNKHYKALLIIPLFLFVLAVSYLGVNYAQTGDIIAKDVSLTGGITATVYLPADIENIEEGLRKELPQSDFRVTSLNLFETKTSTGFIVEASDVNENELRSALEKVVELKEGTYSFEETGSTLGKSFYNQMLRAILIAFAFMSLVIFISFRKIISSIAIIQSPVFNITLTLAALDIIGLKISTAGIAAILLTIGYSIDTDIVLTNRIFKKQEGAINQRIVSAMKTGLTMTITTFAALFAGYFFSKSFIIKEMFLIILIALFFDVIATYITNAGILKWYCERRNLK